jgi:DNA helicase HerA-like ATPase
VKFEATDCIAILGTRGSGKTTLSRMIQRGWQKQVILDPVNEYSDGEIVRDFAGFISKIRFYEKNKTKKFRLIVRFSPETEDYETQLNSILRVLYHFKNVQIIIEEIQLFTSAHLMPSYLKSALFTGRHQGLSLVFVTQRPGQLNKNILSQCSHIFAGLIHEKNDFEYLKPTFGKYAEQLPNIPKGNFLYYSPGKSISIINNGFKK